MGELEISSNGLSAACMAGGDRFLPGLKIQSLSAAYLAGNDFDLSAISSDV